VGGSQREVVQVDRNVGGDRSHVQEGFEWRPKEEGLIYPRNNPDWVKPNGTKVLTDQNQSGMERSCCGKKAAVVERCGLQCSS